MTRGKTAQYQGTKVCEYTRHEVCLKDVQYDNIENKSLDKTV